MHFGWLKLRICCYWWFLCCTLVSQFQCTVWSSQLQLDLRRLFQVITFNGNNESTKKLVEFDNCFWSTKRFLALLDHSIISWDIKELQIATNNFAQNQLNPSFPDSLICRGSRGRKFGKFRPLRRDCTRLRDRRMSRICLWEWIARD